MPTPFRFEHTFRASSPAVVFGVYFDVAHRDEQDRRSDISKREVVEDVDNPRERRRTSRVYPRRQLPAIVRALVNGDLSFDETVVWTKADDAIEFDIQPRLLDGKAHIVARYQLRALGDGRVHRVYEGTVSVGTKLIGGRIEKAIVEDLGRTLPISAACTQEYIDRAEARP